MCGIPNVMVYINALLVHSKNHEDHLVYLEKVLQRLQENHMKLNIKKSFLGIRKSFTFVLFSHWKALN